MKKTSVLVGWAVLTVLAVALVDGGRRMLGTAQQQACAACGRDLDARTRVTGRVEGRPTLYCCPACVLAEDRQTDEAVEIIELTDYATSQNLEPDAAFLVVGGNINHCMRGEPLLDRHKEASPKRFDRCSPSIFVFSDEQDAKDFIARSGGEVMAFSELAASLR